MPTPKSRERLKSTPSKRCLKCWGGGTPTENIDVISRQTKNSNVDQLADLRDDLVEMESDHTATLVGR